MADVAERLENYLSGIFHTRQQLIAAYRSHQRAHFQDGWQDIMKEIIFDLDNTALRLIADTCQTISCSEMKKQMQIMQERNNDFKWQTWLYCLAENDRDRGVDFCQASVNSYLKNAPSALEVSLYLRGLKKCLASFSSQSDTLTIRDNILHFYHQIRPHIYLRISRKSYKDWIRWFVSLVLLTLTIRFFNLKILPNKPGYWWLKLISLEGLLSILLLLDLTQLDRLYYYKEQILMFFRALASPYQAYPKNQDGIWRFLSYCQSLALVLSRDLILPLIISLMLYNPAYMVALYWFSQIVSETVWQVALYIHHNCICNDSLSSIVDNITLILVLSMDFTLIGAFDSRANWTWQTFFGSSTKISWLPYSSVLLSTGTMFSLAALSTFCAWLVRKCCIQIDNLRSTTVYDCLRADEARAIGLAINYAQDPSIPHLQPPSNNA